MSKEYWVHIHSHTSYIVKADSGEQAEEIAQEEFDNINFDSEKYISHEEGRIEVSETEDYK